MLDLGRKPEVLYTAEFHASRHQALAAQGAVECHEIQLVRVAYDKFNRVAILWEGSFALISLRTCKQLLRTDSVRRIDARQSCKCLAGIVQAVRAAQMVDPHGQACSLVDVCASSRYVMPELRIL